jgi:hypothetical protein
MNNEQKYEWGENEKENLRIASIQADIIQLIKMWFDVKPSVYDKSTNSFQIMVRKNPHCENFNFDFRLNEYKNGETQLECALKNFESVKDRIKIEILY